jgi:SAM-dependent methyltransferase
MFDTKCIICDQFTRGNELVPEKLPNENDLVEIFSARRVPDKITFSWIRCENCGLLRASPVKELDLTLLYSESLFDYDSMTVPLTKTYLKILNNNIAINSNTSVLEIGGGNGFLLDALTFQGVRDFVEIEPSKNAFSKASARVKSNFIVSMFDKDLKLDRNFNIVMSFHVFDHLSNPKEFLTMAKGILGGNGKLLLVMHNEKSLSAKILQKRSPIFDIEHRYLFNQVTLRKILQESGFFCEKIETYWNCVTLKYLIHLMPFPKIVKKFLLNFCKILKVDSLMVWLPLGNMFAIASLDEN